MHDDVAPAQIIAARADAHRFARLYFRPRTPTQYQVEGIRRNGDFYLNNSANHVPLLYMFLFSTESVLTLPNTHFSNGNMQSPNTTFGHTEQFFNSIAFEKVFHEGSFSANEKDQILKSRCAEVLAQSPLDLAQHLKFVLCRSDAERNTLLHSCGAIGAGLKNRVRTFSEVGIFQSEFPYVRSVDLNAEHCLIEISPRRDGKPISFEMIVFGAQDQRIQELNSVQIDPAKRLRVNFSQSLMNGSYRLEMKIDGQTAYKNEHVVDDLPF